MQYSCDISALLMFLLFLIIFMNKTCGHFASCWQTAQG